MSKTIEVPLTNPLPSVPDVSQVNELAKFHWILYNGWLKCGFTELQAMQLMIALIAGVNKK